MGEERVFCLLITLYSCFLWLSSQSPLTGLWIIPTFSHLSPFYTTIRHSSTQCSTENNGDNSAIFLLCCLALSWVKKDRPIQGRLFSIYRSRRICSAGGMISRSNAFRPRCTTGRSPNGMRIWVGSGIVAAAIVFNRYRSRAVVPLWRSHCRH